MARMQAVYYRAPDGSESVDAFVHYGSEHYRVIYRRSKNPFVLLHMFRKDTGKVPEAQLRVARQRWEDFKARMGAERRRPPRAAGHDAT